MSKPVVFMFRLDVERSKRGLSRQALAAAIGVPVETYDRLFRGVPLETRQRDELLRRVARVFGMPEWRAWGLLDHV
jgi:transcriptional regulator with XRE-family HTH domain